MYVMGIADARDVLHCTASRCNYLYVEGCVKNAKVRLSVHANQRASEARSQYLVLPVRICVTRFKCNQRLPDHGGAWGICGALRGRSSFPITLLTAMPWVNKLAGGGGQTHVCFQMDASEKETYRKGRACVGCSSGPHVVCCHGSIDVNANNATSSQKHGQ